MDESRSSTLSSDETPEAEPPDAETPQAAQMDAEQTDAEPTDNEPPADLDRELDAIIAGQKRRRTVTMIGAAVVVVLVAGAVGLWIALQPEPRCDPDDVETFLSEPSLPVGTVGKVCKFDGALEDALEAAEVVRPDMAGLLVMKAITEEPTLITDVCPGGIKGLAEAPRERPGEQVDVFLRHCEEIESTELSQSSLRSASLERVVLAVAIYGQLRDSDPDVAPRLADVVLTRP